MDTGSARHLRVVVVGAGIGGLAVAYALRTAGIDDFTVLERGHTVGGTWRDNTYPGCGCDIPSHLYSFSFAPKADWSRVYSGQPDILRYLQDVAVRLDLDRHLEFGVEVLGAHWDDDAARWRIRTSTGELSADVLVGACGYLVEPAVPAIPGLADFAGPVFHSSRWRHDVDLSGLRVAVVGTGASAVQFVPRIQPIVAQLTLFQRTPPWVLPKHDRAVKAGEQRLYARIPALQRAVRAGQYLKREMTALGFVRYPALLAPIEQAAKKHLRDQVADPALRSALTPSYKWGCKRILTSSDFYPAVAQPNVELVASGLAAVEGSKAVGADGTTREVDAIVLGTGFDVAYPIAAGVHGRDGRTLAETWAAEGRTALRGAAVAGFPNLFLIYGPNTGVGHNSAVYMIESQAAYVADAVAAMGRAGIGVLDPKPAAQQAWNAEVRRRMGRTVWQTGGCASWYQDAAGSNTVLWPGLTPVFRRATRRVDLTEYETRAG